MATIDSRSLKSAEKIHDGIITDMSDSGICLLTANPLSRGQKIIINSASSSSRTAVVRWSEKFDSLYYTVGLEFV